MTYKDNKQKTAKRLGELLLESGYIDEIQLAVALGKQKEYGLKLGSQLLKLGFVAERDLAEILREQLGIQWISLFDREIPQEVIDAVPEEVALKYTVMPVEYDKKTITLATTNPNDLDMLDSLVFQLGKKIRPVMALEFDIEKAIITHYKIKEEDFPAILKERYSQRSKAPVKDITMAMKPHGETTISPGELQGFNEIPLSTEQTLSKKPVPQPPASPQNKVSLQQALISLLIRKKLISKAELFDELMRIEQKKNEE